MKSEYARRVVKPNWFEEPYNEKEYLKRKHSVPKFTSEEMSLNIKKRDDLLRKLSGSIESENIDADLLIYGSQRYFPSSGRDTDLLIFCSSSEDALKLNKILGGRTEPILRSNELESEFSLFRLNRTWNSAQVSAGIVFRRTLERSIEQGFNVPITSIRQSKPPAFSIKRGSTFEGVPFWFEVNNDLKVIEGEEYWFRDYSSWVVDEQGAPITVPFYFEQILSASMVYTPNEHRLNDYFMGITNLANEACNQFNQNYDNGEVINSFVRKGVFPEWFVNTLELKLSKYLL